MKIANLLQRDITNPLKLIIGGAVVGATSGFVVSDLLLATAVFSTHMIPSSVVAGAVWGVVVNFAVSLPWFSNLRLSTFLGCSAWVPALVVLGISLSMGTQPAGLTDDRIASLGFMSTQCLVAASLGLTVSVAILCAKRLRLVWE